MSTRGIIEVTSESESALIVYVQYLRLYEE